MTLSDELKAEFFKQHSGVCLLDTMEITDPALAAPIRLVWNTEDITSNGNVFKACSLEFSRARETEDQPGETTISIDNADLAILELLEQIPPVKDEYSKLTYRMIKSDEPDFYEMEETFDITNMEVSVDSIILSLVKGSWLRERVSLGRIEPSTHPAAFTTNL